MHEAIQGKDVHIVDLGANIGIAALKLTAQVNSLGAHTVFLTCVEPDPSNFDILSKNVKGDCLNAAATNEDKVYIDNISNPKSTSTYRTSKDFVEGAEVTGISLNTLSKKLSRNNCNILKIDIEGYEWKLLEATDIDSLSKFNMIFIESHEDSFGIDFSSCHMKLEKAGFKLILQNGEDRIYIAQHDEC